MVTCAHQGPEAGLDWRTWTMLDWQGLPRFVAASRQAASVVWASRPTSAVSAGLAACLSLAKLRAVPRASPPRRAWSISSTPPCPGLGSPRGWSTWALRRIIAYLPSRGKFGLLYTLGGPSFFRPAVFPPGPSFTGLLEPLGGFRPRPAVD